MTEDLFSYIPRARNTDPPTSHVAAESDIPQAVYTAFLDLARQVQRAGHKRYSADAILHRIRWHRQIERGERDFKCNNNWTSQLARWAMAQEPSLAGFFETRRAAA